MVTKEDVEMKSPFTGGLATLRHEPLTIAYRKENYEIEHLYYECDETHERFTTNELDTVSLRQVHNQYRTKYGLPFPDEIVNIRLQYGLSAAKMSEILGFGDNQYRLYEGGDMPSEANGKVIRSVADPKVMKVFVDNARNQFDEKEFARIEAKLQKSIMEASAGEEREVARLIFSTYSRSEANGFAPQSIARLKNLMLYFIQQAGSVFNTKMNKLLFYTDFLAYKHTGMSVSGLAYKAIQYGPVPVRWDRVYSLIDGIEQELIQFESGVTGQLLTSTETPDLNLFTEDEITIMNTVQQRFKDCTASQISIISHEEEAWKQYVNTQKLIDYKEAFGLKVM